MLSAKNISHSYDKKNKFENTGPEAIMIVKIHIVVFWVITPFYVISQKTMIMAKQVLPWPQYERLKVMSISL
jgi:hypothetical protein